jgi:hypothetical protein
VGFEVGPFVVKVQGYAGNRFVSFHLVSPQLRLESKLSQIS